MNIPLFSSVSTHVLSKSPQKLDKKKKTSIIMHSFFIWGISLLFTFPMNKNTTILLGVGAIAVLAIAAGAYVSMSKPSDQEFITQSMRKNNTIKKSTVSKFENDSTVQWKLIIKHNSNWSCSVTFDDWITKKWDSKKNDNGSLCCYIDHDAECNGCIHDPFTCYSWKETWVSWVSYDDQLVEEYINVEIDK